MRWPNRSEIVLDTRVVCAVGCGLPYRLQPTGSERRVSVRMVILVVWYVFLRRIGLAAPFPWAFQRLSERSAYRNAADHCFFAAKFATETTLPAVLCVNPAELVAPFAGSGRH